MNTLQIKLKTKNKSLLTWLQKMLKMFSIFAFTHFHSFFRFSKTSLNWASVILEISRLIFFNFKAPKSVGLSSYTRPLNIPQKKKSGGVKSGLRAGHFGFGYQSGVKHFLQHFLCQIRSMTGGPVLLEPSCGFLI